MPSFAQFQRKPKPAPEVPEDRAHPLEAVPLRHEKIEERRCGNASLQLRGHFPSSGLLGKVSKTETVRQLELDDKGACFWSLVDGQRNLFEISDTLQSRFKLEEEESRQATILFVKMLMRRGFIRLKFHPVHGGPPSVEEEEDDS